MPWVFPEAGIPSFLRQVFLHCFLRQVFLQVFLWGQSPNTANVTKPTGPSYNFFVIGMALPPEGGGGGGWLARHGTLIRWAHLD